MFATRNHEAPGKKQGGSASGGKAASSEPQTLNPLWHQLATRVQAKLSVSAADDPSEREADHVADQVMRMPAPVVQRSCATCAAGGKSCPKCEEEEQAERPTIHRKARDEGDGSQTLVADDFAANLGSGQPLDQDTRSFMEPRFRREFSEVRIHTGPAAQESAQAIGALAYTLGPHLIFGKGQYAPSSGQGRRLLAHELTHAVQQQSSPSRTQVSRYRDVKKSERSIKNWGAIDDPAAGLVEKSSPGKGDPVIETIHVRFTGKEPDRLNPGELLVTGTLTAKYRAADKRSDIVIPVTGGSTAAKPFGLTDRITSGNKVISVEGPGFNDVKVTGQADAQPAPKGEKSHYVKKTSQAGHAAFDFVASMGLAVFFTKDHQAIHLGDKKFGSHACIHVDWTANKDEMRFINYHSKIGFTTVTVEYDKNADFKEVCCSPTRRLRGFVNPCNVFKESDCP